MSISHFLDSTVKKTSVYVYLASLLMSFIVFSSISNFQIVSVAVPIAFLPLCYQSNDLLVHFALSIVYTVLTWLVFYGYEFNGLLVTILLGCYILSVTVPPRVYYVMIPTLLFGVDYSGILAGVFLVISKVEELKLVNLLFIQGISGVLSLPLIYLEYQKVSQVDLFVSILLMTTISISYSQIHQNWNSVAFGLLWSFLWNIANFKSLFMLFTGLIYYYFHRESISYKSLKTPKALSRTQLKVVIIASICIFANLMYLETGKMDILKQVTLEPQFSNSESVRLLKRKQCFNKLQKVYMDALKEILPKHDSAVLIDVANHDNLGDVFIWLGEEIALSRIGVQINYHCLSHTNQCTSVIPTLKAKVNEKTAILLQGGGNFGDLYRFETKLRNIYVKEFPNNVMVFFPQSIYYKNKTLMKTDSDLYSKHDKLHLMVRSEQSKNILDTHFIESKRYLVPDSAFMIGSIEPNCEPHLDLVILKRTDQESILPPKFVKYIHDRMAEKGYTYKIFDWFDYPKEERNYGYYNGKPTDPMRLPRWALDVGNRMLCQGRVVLTDRLHATILSLLMDKPVVALENNYKKIREVTHVIEKWGGDDCGENVLRRKYKMSKDLSVAMDAVFEYLEKK
eukprot:NODE_86_length_22163_cov_0.379442.p2 type:complete len:623 gc:universal NODE_86_length_22163_cov_0.379442:2290-4158(+)